MIEIKGLTKVINDEKLFKSESLKFGQGIYIVTGENGCGKSSLFKIINGVDLDYTGSVMIDKQDIRHLGAEKIHHQYIAYQSQKSDLFSDLTFKQNIDLILDEYDDTLLAKLLNDFHLKDVYHSKQKLKKCSGGEKQKVGLVINLLKACPILMLDEVDNNLDTEAIEQLVMCLAKLTDKCVLIISHNLDFYDSLNYQELAFEEKQVFLKNKTESDGLSLIYGEEKLDSNLEASKQKVKLTRSLIDNS